MIYKCLNLHLNKNVTFNGLHVESLFWSPGAKRLHRPNERTGRESELGDGGRRGGEGMTMGGRSVSSPDSTDGRLCHATPLTPTLV